MIIDRWGQRVYESWDWKAKGWAGDYNGNGTTVPEGVYMFMMQATDFDNEVIQKFNGPINVIR